MTHAPALSLVGALFEMTVRLASPCCLQLEQ